MNRIDRLHAILTHLQSKKRVTAQEIADRFGISLRTVYRDIKAIDASGVPIIGEAGSGYTIMEGYRLPPVMFTQDEAASLLLAGKLASQMTDESVQQHVGTALFKIKAVLRSSDKDHVEALSNHIEIREPRMTVSENSQRYLAALQKAIVEKRVIGVRYRSNLEDRVTEREVEPIGLFHYSNHWHLIGWCRLRNDYRDFRISRIERLQVLEENFRDRSHLSLQEYIRQPSNFSAPVYEIVIRFSKEAARYIFDQKYYYGFVKEENCDDFVRMYFVAGFLRGFGQWLLSFTRHVQVESPAELKLIMNELVRELNHHYPDSASL